MKVTLKGIRPLHLVVPSDMPFDRRHHVIQIAMGRENAHPEP